MDGDGLAAGDDGRDESPIFMATVLMMMVVRIFYGGGLMLWVMLNRVIAMLTMVTEMFRRWSQYS